MGGMWGTTSGTIQTFGGAKSPNGPLLMGPGEEGQRDKEQKNKPPAVRKKGGFLHGTGTCPSRDFSLPLVRIKVPHKTEETSGGMQNT